jgi:hypothetical protein
MLGYCKNAIQITENPAVNKAILALCFELCLFKDL